MCRPPARLLARLAFGLALLATPALAQDIDVDLDYEIYEIDGDTLPEIWDDIQRDGPGGFTGYTSWYVNWTADCQVSLTATITLPELGDDDDLSRRDEAEFARMLAALDEHELGHVAMGMGFAEDVRAAGCGGDTGALHAKWIANEKAYDADTNHGQTQGAWLNLD